MATKKKYPTVEENLARRKYYTGTRPVATTSNGMGPVYIDTGDGHHNDTAYTPSQPHYFNPNKADTSGAPTYKAPEAYKAPEPYKAPEAYKAPNFADYQSRDYTTPEFKSGWGDQLQSLYNQIAGRGKFTYDQSKDPLYQQYAEMYRKNAQLAMSDTVAKAASLTGGYGNSYAETAGQSMYNQTMDQLNERALDLYDRALNAWALEGDQLNQRFNMAGQMYNNDYNAWRDQVSDIQRAQEFDYNRYLNDRDFGYDQYINERNFGYDQWRDARDFGYSQYRDAVGDARWQYETDYGRYRDSVDDAWRQKTFDNDNYWRKTELDNDNYWRQQQFDWDKETYNRDDAFRYGQLGEQARQFDAGLGLDYAQLAEQARQYSLGYGLDAFNAGYDPVTGRMTDEAKARQDAADEFQYWQAGYDPATKGMSAEAKQQYKDSLALDYAKLGMNPDGSLNALGKANSYEEAYKEQVAAAAGNTPNVQEFIKKGGKTGNNVNVDGILTRENFEKTVKQGHEAHVLGKDENGKTKGKGYSNYEDYVTAWLNTQPQLSEAEAVFLYDWLTSEEHKKSIKK